MSDQSCIPWISTIILGDIVLIIVSCFQLAKWQAATRNDKAQVIEITFTYSRFCPPIRKGQDHMYMVFVYVFLGSFCFLGWIGISFECLGQQDQYLVLQVLSDFMIDLSTACIFFSLITYKFYYLEAGYKLYKVKDTHIPFWLTYTLNIIWFINLLCVLSDHIYSWASFKRWSKDFYSLQLLVLAWLCWIFCAYATLNIVILMNNKKTKRCRVIGGFALASILLSITTKYWIDVTIFIDYDAPLDVRVFSTQSFVFSALQLMTFTTIFLISRSPMCPISCRRSSSTEKETIAICTSQIDNVPSFITPSHINIHLQAAGLDAVANNHENLMGLEKALSMWSTEDEELTASSECTRTTLEQSTFALMTCTRND